MLWRGLQQRVFGAQLFTFGAQHLGFGAQHLALGAHLGAQHFEKQLGMLILGQRNLGQQRFGFGQQPPFAP